jgi:hypothetical protein
VRTALLVFGLALIQPLRPDTGLRAQVRGYLDAGSGTMHSGSESPFGIVRVAPSFQVTTARFTVAGNGNFAGHTEHGWQSAGHLEAEVRQPLFGLLETRVGVLGAASRTRWGRSAGGWLGNARVQWGTPSRGFLLGLGAGQTLASSGAQPLSRIEAGGWSRLGRIDLGFWLKRTGLFAPGSSVQDNRNPTDTLGAGGAPGTRRLLQDHYTDIEASVGWSHRNLAIEAGAGRRIGKAFRYTSWHIQVLYQVTNRVALVANSGQFPVDIVSGLPAGGFATLSMRLNLRDDAPLRVIPTLPTPSVGSIADFRASAQEDGTHLILVRVPRASVVELMGDFTDWTPILLVPGEDDTWRLRMHIPAGIHEVNLRVDGGSWTVPPGLTGVDDNFGGKAGRFVIE